MVSGVGERRVCLRRIRQKADRPASSLDLMRRQRRFVSPCRGGATIRQPTVLLAERHTSRLREPAKTECAGAPPHPVPEVSADGPTSPLSPLHRQRGQAPKGVEKTSRNRGSLHNSLATITARGLLRKCNVLRIIPHLLFSAHACTTAGFPSCAA